MATERDYDESSERYADPDVAVNPTGEALAGARATAAARAFLLDEYGSFDDVDVDIRRGRRRTGDQRQGASPVIRARISDRDFAAFKRLEELTGRTQADLVREGVHLLLAHHELAS